MSNNLSKIEFLIKILNIYAYFSNLFTNITMNSTNYRIVFCYDIAI